MKVFILITLLFMSATGCGIVKKKNSELKSVKIEGIVHKPYCGGAKPSPDVAAGYFETMKFAEYKLFKGVDYTDKAEYLQEVRMDISGLAKLQLAPGDYFLLRVDKTLSMDQFIALNCPVEEKLYSKSENSCFQEWMRAVDLKFKVVNDTVIEFRENAKCWVGTNPCIKYIGPPAP
jgi:hypothetical protein